jgi:aminoglycoside 6'-N-acetyltransferase
MSRYQFQPMTAADLPLVRNWLQQPHVTAWWGEPEEQFTLVSEDVSQPAMDQLIVICDGRPFADLQCYDQSAWPEGGLGIHPAGTRGIDQFIGEADMVGKGHGSAFIRDYIEGLLVNGTPRVVTDPDPGNARAIRAYQKAGFAKQGLVDTPEGVALLMVRNA